VPPWCLESLHWYSSFPTIGKDNSITIINHLFVFFVERLLSNISKAELDDLAKKMMAATSQPKESLMQKGKAPTLITQAPTDHDEETTSGLIFKRKRK